MRTTAIAAVAFAVLLVALPHAPAQAVEIPWGTQPEITTTADEAEWVTAADLDGDGDLDVIVASRADDTIAWYRNDGNSPPGWAEVIVTEDPDGAGETEGYADSVRMVVAVDMDGDGDLDLVSASASDDKIAWYDNADGLGGFGTKTEVGTSADFARAVFAGDLDGDGDPDLLSASENDDAIAWYENQGASWLATDITTGADGAASVFAADLDGDGDLDALAASENDDKVAWHRNNGGASTWTEFVITQDPDGAGGSEGEADGVYTAIAADLDLDGDLDVISASLNDDKVAWYPNDGTGIFGAQQSITLSAVQAVRLDVADMDADGDLDVLCASFGDDTVAWYENPLVGSLVVWTEHPITTSALAAISVAAADVDGDGDLDVLSASNADDTVEWFENQTIHRSALFPQRQIITTVAGYADLATISTADIDGDGDADVLSAAGFDDNVVWYENTDGLGTFGTQNIISSAVDFPEAALGADLDNDGDVDVVSASSDDDKIAWYENTDGNGTFGTQNVISSAADVAIAISIADLDGDADIDIVSVSIQDDKLAWYENLGGSFGVQDVISTDGDSPEDVHTADVDGDGDIDILVVSSNDNEIAWFENDGSASFGPQQIISTTQAYPDTITTGDIDGDGDLDVVVGAFDDDSIVWYRNDGPPRWTENRFETGADGVLSVAVADLDLDGDLDILAGSGLDDTFAWYENTDGAGSFSARQVITDLALGPDGVVLADVDGDGGLDVIGASIFDDTIAWHPNRGGQFALPTTVVAPANLESDTRTPLMAIAVEHRGRTGDTDVEFAEIELLFEKDGAPMHTGDYVQVFTNMRIYLDDGSGQFEGEPTDSLVTSGFVFLSGGVGTYSLPDGDPDAQVPFGASSTYFVVGDVAPFASELFHDEPIVITHLTESSSSAEDRDNDIALTLEFSGNTATAGMGISPSVTSVTPADDSLDVPTGTNVTLVFTEELLPGSVTTSTVKLLDPLETAVPATVGLTPDGLTVTLDPNVPQNFGALDTDTVYTVEVDGVTDLAGYPAAKFTSRFETGTPAGRPLPTVSDQAVLPSPPAFAPPPGAAAAFGEPFGNNLGYSAAAAGDLDDDGFADVLAGAPNYSPTGTTAAGAVAVYLGSDAPEPESGNHPREVADIIFLGESSHDRVGTAVVGGFDFDGDDVEDILIGAEQIDRTGAPSTAMGPGRVYLVLFKPLEYDRDPIDGVPDYETGSQVFIELDEVGTTISGVVFEGVATGDQAGFALAAGGDLENTPDGEDEIVIGSPGYGGRDGRAYVVFSDPTLSGTAAAPVELANVAASIDGAIYEGANAERLGNALALPGDIVDPVGLDLAIGAPLADATSMDSGAVYVAPVSGLSSGSVDASSLTTRIHGDQPCEQLGFSVAAGGDNRADGSPAQSGGDPDLLIGAPYFDRDASSGDPCAETTPEPNAGRVLQTTGRLPQTTFTATDVGSTVHGVRWIGAVATDRLGWSVNRLGDVSGNGLEDIGFGAPYANPGTNQAGAVYVVEGSANTGLLGERSAGLVGQTTSGGIFTGVQDSERAGLVLSAAGDMDNSSSGSADDFAVGSPGWDGELGTVHQVLESILQQPGECTPLGCTVADLDTGAVLEVPANSLATGTKIRLSVEGLVDTVTQSSACGPSSVPGMTLTGSSYNLRIDTDCGSPPCDAPPFALPPDVDIPVRPELQHQIGDGEQLPVRYCDDTFGWLQVPVGPANGLVQANQFVIGELAVSAEQVDTLRLYGAFFDDADQDEARTTCDCDDGDATIWAPPGPVETLTADGDAQTATLLRWDPPQIVGGTDMLYDTVRSTSPNDFVNAVTCIEGDDSDTTAEDAAVPTPGQTFYYRVSPENACPGDTPCFDPGLPPDVVDCPAS
ncbi:MAG: hypothetical protein GY716_22370 [bacterium]|nr:hypothetical protein [bacterium]